MNVYICIVFTTYYKILILNLVFLFLIKAMSNTLCFIHIEGIRKYYTNVSADSTLAHTSMYWNSILSSSSPCSCMYGRTTFSIVEGISSTATTWSNILYVSVSVLSSQYSARLSLQLYLSCKLSKSVSWMISFCSLTNGSSSHSISYK